MEFETRRLWQNMTGNQTIFPLRVYHPTKIEELAAIVSQAERDGVTVRAVGAHHSWSDAALTTGYVIETHGLTGVRDVDVALLKPGGDPGRLVSVRGGTRLQDVNPALADRKLALENMGGYDAQTIAGVMATATHGSGIALGPIVDQVRSLDLVVSGGRMVRIEPSGGITDPERFKAARPDWSLEQDSDVFDAARVSVGCFGIVDSVVLEAVPAYWLNEVRVLRPWSEVRADLESGVLDRHRHYEVYFNPHPTLPNGGHQCIVTTRDPTGSPAGLPKDRRSRNWLVEVGGDSRLLAAIIRRVYRWWPQWTPRIVDLGLKGLPDKGYANVSYKVFNIGAANHLPAISSEIGVPVDGRGTHLKAVDRVLAIAAKWRDEGRIYHSSPIALRFVRASTAHLAMMEGRNTMMIELILFHPTDGGPELLAAYEDALTPLGGRPHWGQVNYVSATEAELTRMYPKYPRWKAIHARFNQSGVFNSPFTKRVGLTETAAIP